MVWRKRTAVGVLSAFGLALFAVEPANAHITYITPGVIHCPNGHNFQIPVERAPPGVGSLRDAASGANVNQSGLPLDAEIARASQYEAAKERCSNDWDNEQVLAGKFGQWAAFWLAWDQNRSEIYFHILGKWAAYVAMFGIACFLLFGRKSR